jgi:hypothetical protein
VDHVLFFFVVTIDILPPTPVRMTFEVCLREFSQLLVVTLPLTVPCSVLVPVEILLGQLPVLCYRAGGIMPFLLIARWMLALAASPPIDATLDRSVTAMVDEGTKQQPRTRTIGALEREAAFEPTHPQQQQIHHRLRGRRCRG